jgi:hypothetical protein
MILLCFVSEGNSDTILWEQLWYPRKQSTAIPYYENSYDTFGNKAQQYHSMRTVMIPSETKHSDNGIAVLCFRGYHNCFHSMVLLCFASEGIITVLIVFYYYEDSYDTLGNKEQRYHTMRTAMIPSETKHSNTILWEQLWYPRKQSTALPYYENSYDSLITVLIVWYCCALFPRVL